MEVSKFGLLWAIVLSCMIVSVQGQRSVEEKEKAGPPLNVRSTGHTQTSVSFSWTAPKKLPVGGHYISGYKILYKVEGTKDSSGKKIDVPADTSYTITDLAPGTSYMFKIATITSNGKVGGFSSWNPVRTDDAPEVPPPDPPGNVRGSADGTNIDVSWTPPSTPIDGYVISYGKNSVDENSLEVSQGEQRAQISGLDAGSTYQVAVQSVSGGQRSSAETFSATTDAPVPSSPGNLRLRSTSDSIDAEWAHNSVAQDGVTGFEVSVGPDSNPTEQTLNLGNSARFTTVSGLQPDQVYVVSVTAQNEFGNSQPVTDKISTQAAASTGGGGGGAANSPPNGMQIREGSDRATVTWEAATNDVDGYVVNMGPESNPNQFSRRVPSGARRRIKQDGLEPDTDYQVSIKSYDSEGESQPIQQGFRTKPRETRSRGPRRPSGTKVKSRYDSLGVTWEEPEGDDVTGYRLEAGPPSNPRQFTRDYDRGTTSADITGLSSDTDYQVNLYSRSRSGNSEPVRRRARTRQTRRPPRPQSVTASSPSPNSIDVEWQGPRDSSVSGYRVDVGIPSDPQRTFSQRYPGSTNRATIPNLNEDTEYQVSVVSTSESGESEPVRKSVKTQIGDTNRPPRPNGMRVRESMDSATVNWEAASGDVDEYIVNMGADGNLDQFSQRVRSSDRRRIRQSGLKPDTDYQVSIKSVKDGTESEAITQGFRTRPRRAQPTRPPTGMRVNTRYDSMAVQWEEPEDENVNGYRLEVGTPDDPRQFVEEYPRGTDTAVVPDLDPDTRYQVNLVSTSESGESSPVTRRARTRRTRRPKRPQRTRASSSSPDSIDVTWQEPDDDNVDGYRVDVGTPSNPRSKFSQRLPRGTTSVNVPRLDPDSDYQVSVVSTSPSGESEPVRKTASTQRRGGAFTSPPNGMRVNEETSSARLNWGPSGSDDIEGYTVNIGTPNNPTQFSENVPSTTTSFRQKGLRPDTLYQASVKAYGPGGESEPMQQGFKTKPKRPQRTKPPTNTRARERYDSIAVSWDEPDDPNVDGYRVEVGTPSEPNQASYNFPRGTTDFTIPDLDPDTDYQVNLYSTSPSGDSDPVTRRGRTRRNRRPKRPARAKVNPSSNSLDIRWDEAKGDNVEGYRVNVGTSTNPRVFSRNGISDTSISVPNLDPDTDYEVQIVTNAAGRESEPLTKSARTTASTGGGGSGGGAANSPPNGMQIREGSDRATVTWEAATNDVDGYVVNMGPESNPNQFTQRVPSSDRRRIKQDGLEPETDYQVSIKSYDSEGESQPIQQGFRTRPTRSRNPQAPTGTRVNRRYDTLGVTWEEPEGDDVTGYRLEAGPPSNPRQFTRDYDRGTTSADITGLSSDTDYQVNLYSRSSSGNSEPVRRRARTRSMPRPQRPQRMRTNSPSPDTLDVNWEQPNDNNINGYRVDVGTPANPRRDFSRRYPAGTSSASIPNLRPDSDYQVSVVSTSPSGESEPARRSARTQNDGTRRGPTRPNGMRVREGINSATVDWEPATNDVDGYIVNMGPESEPDRFTQRVPSTERRRFRQDGLDPDTDYLVSVKSYDDQNRESEAIQRGFRTRPERPQRIKSPTGVRTNPRYDSMAVQWEEPEDENVDGYRLEVGTPSDPRQFVREYDRGTTVATVPDLDPETDYQINLVSTSESGDSEPVRRRARTRRTRRPQRPQRTRASSSSPDSIDVTWQEPDDDSVDGYRVDVGTPSNPRSKFSQRLPRGTTSVNVPRLDEDSEYQISVVSTSPTGESEPVRKSVKTRSRRPRTVSPPNGIQINEEASSARLNWGPSGSDDIEGYTVNIGTPNNPTEFSENVPSTTTSFRQKGLRPNTFYQASVKARGPGGESEPLQQHFKTRPSRSRGPSPPTNTRARERYDSIAVSWDEPEDPNVDGYRVEVGTPSEPNQASYNFPRGTTDFTIPDLDPDTDYQVNLYSTSPSGDSDPVTRRGRTRKNRRPKRPPRAKVSPGSDSLMLRWDEPEGDNIDGYRVDIGTPSNPRQFTQRFDRGQSQHTFSGLSPGTDYQVKIVSLAGDEESEPLTKAARTSGGGSGGGAANSPANGMQIREGSDRATVTWEAATNDVDGYVVNMGPESNPNQFTQRVPSSERRRIKQDGLEPETDYQVSIKSYDSEGESQPIQQGFRTRPTRSRNPQAPTGTRVNRRYDSLGVTWEEPEGDDVTGYRLEAGPPSNPRQFTRDYDRGTTSADITGLSSDTDYQVNLYSRSRSGNSEPVRRSARTRPTRRPQRPQRMRTNSPSPDTIDVNWEQPNDNNINGYRVDVGTPANPRRDFSRRYPAGTSSASIPNLRPDSEYQVSVVSTSPSGESEPARRSVRTQDDGTRSGPTRPNGMRVREGINSATVDWEPATNDVDGYIVNMGPESEPDRFTQRVPSTERRRFRQDGLDPDTDYLVSVKSYDDQNRESEAIQRGFRTRPERPQRIKSPTGVRTNPRYDSMAVQWEEPEDENVDGYRLEVGTPSDPRQFVREYDRGTTVATVPDLDPETDYQINLVSTSESGDSEPVRRRARTRRTRRPKRPQRTRASSSSPDSIDVTWQEPDDDNVDGYRVDVGTPSNPRSKFSQRLPRGTNSVNVPRLDEDTEYQVSVVSTSPTGESEPVRKSVKTQRRSPRTISPPNGMQLNEEASSVRVNWEPSGSDDIDGYTVNIGTPNNPNQFSENVPSTTTSLRQKGLRPSTDYQVSVKARASGVESEPIQQGFTTKPKRSRGPSPPTNTRARERYDSIAVSWDEPEDPNVNGYRVEVGTPSEPNLASYNFPRGTTDFTIPDLDPDTDYQVKLFSTSPARDSDPVTRRGKTRKNRRPKRPPRAKVSPGSDSLMLRWDEPEGDNIDGYRVDIGTPSNPRQFTQRFDRGQSQHTFSGLSPETDYQVKVVSLAGDEESEPLTKAARTSAPGSSPQGGAANSPPNGMQIREGSDRATVNWEAATNDVDGYVVNMGPESNPNQFTQRVPSSDRRRIKQDGLEPETDYQVSIKSYDSDGESQPIQQGFRTRPRQSRSPKPPTGTRVNRRYDSLGVTWEEPEGDDVTGYRLEAGPPSNPRQFTRDYDRGTTSADITGLSSDTDYQVNLYSRSRSGNSEPVRRSARTRSTRRPQRPQETTATSSRPDSIDVTWQEPDDDNVDGYRVDVGTPSNPRSKFSQRLPRGTNSVNVPRLDEDTEYQVSVVSTSPTGESEPVRKSVKTPRSRPRGSSPPNGLWLNEDTDSVDINWGASGTDNIEGYIVNIGPPDNPTQFSERVPKTTNFRHTGLEPNRDYQVSVQAYGPDGESDPVQRGFRTRPSRSRAVRAPANTRAIPRYDSIPISWDEPEDPNVNGYRVEVGTPSEPNQASYNFPRGTTDFTIPDLDPDTNYQVNLFSTSPSGDSDPITRRAKTRKNRRPQKPSGTRVTPGIDSLDVNWVQPEGANIAGYRLDVGTPSNPQQFSRRLPADTRNLEVDGLEPNTDYQVNLVSTSPDGRESEPVRRNTRTTGDQTAPVGTPETPTGVDVTTEGNNLRVSWNAQQGVTGYIVRAGLASRGFPPNDVEERVNSRKDQVLLRNLQPDTDYVLTVSSVNQEGESRPARATGTTDLALPGRPEGLAAETTSRTATLSWREPGTPVDGYRLTLGTVTFPDMFTERLRPNTNEYTFENLDPDTIYTAELTSYNSAGTSMPISAKLRTEPGPARQPPEAPGRMELTATPSRINIRWQPSIGDVTGYRIRLTDPATGETDTVEVDKFQQSYAFTDLEPEKQYEVSIESFNEEGYSRPQVDRVSTGELPGGSELPQNVDIVATGTRIDAHWNPPRLAGNTHPHSYLVIAEAIDEEGNPLGPRESITLHHSQNEHTFTNLLPATKYLVSVHANIEGDITEPVSQEVTTTMDGPIPPINIMAEPISPEAISVSWDFPVETGPPPEVGGRRPDIYYTVRVSNPETGDLYANSREMTADVEGLRPDTLYDVQVAMVYNGYISDYGDNFAVRTFSDVDPRSPQFPTVTQVLLESPDNVHATFNWLPPREDADNIRTYNTEYTMAEDPTLEDTVWESVSSDRDDLGVVISNLPTNGVVHHRTQPVYRGGEKGPYSVIQSFSTPVAERPTPEDQPCQSHEDVTHQRINQITERTVPPLGMPLPYCDQFFSDFPCVWSPVCICIPRGTKSLGALPTSIRPASGTGCSSTQLRDDPGAMYRDEPSRASNEPGPCQAVFDVTLEAIKESHKNTVPLMASSLPSCSEDGYYKNVQCMGTMCMCVDRMGQPTGDMTEVWNVKKLRCA
ncbi:twitchin-like isoform X2 [Lytechinus variegatus]|uniref:twitchin-like isoform X2 n=1 Tax=Lytechinus variegatus TaxID=7654 RepID=UPI001BB2117E|nr:twitchin-like isoform X2 [Lytechinus variegatus]